MRGLEIDEEGWKEVCGSVRKRGRRRAESGEERASEREKVLNKKNQEHTLKKWLRNEPEGVRFKRSYFLRRSYPFPV